MALSTTTTTPTGWAADARYQNYLAAQQIAGKPYTPYQGNMLAPMNQWETSAQQTLGNGWQYGQGAMTAAQNAAQQAAGFQGQQVTPWGPQTAAMQAWMPTQAANAGPAAQMTPASSDVVSIQAANAGPAAQMAAAQLNRGAVRDVTSKNFTDYDINKYLNPHTNTVVNNALNDLSRQNDITNNQTNARAAAAGAFGGSRQAVANTLNNENYLRESGNLSGTLRQKGFDTASGLIMQDANRNLQGQQSNQQMDFNVGNLNTNMSQQAGLQNMLATNNRGEFNANMMHAGNIANQGARNNMSQFNAGNQQAASQYNASEQNRMAQLNAGFGQTALSQSAAAHNQAGVNNQAAINNMSQFNSDVSLRGQALNQAAAQNAANTRITGANALNAMGMDQQRWNANNAAGQLSAGQMQRQQDQAALNEQYRQWAEAQGYDRNQLAYLQSALGGYSSGTAETTPYYNNSAANALAGGIGAGQLLANAPAMIKGATSLWNSLPDIPGFGFGL